ncbi:toprim domain-containing protein, partial [Streptococcus sp. DD13]|uniref:toprim domain-containing protein n=1 Tax=Streptococcus sp. DD13 TaxID=1777881 RepID=UPI001E54FC82
QLPPVGTALTAEHVRHLQKHTKKVVLAYDGDEAGQNATFKALEELHQLQVDIVTFPSKMDPDEFLSKNSPEELARILTKSRLSDVEFLIQHWKPENPENLQLQIEFVDHIAPVIAQTKSITAQNSYILKVAELLQDFTLDQVEQAVNQSRLQKRQIRTQTGPNMPDSSTDRLDRQERHVLPQQPRISNLRRTEHHILYRLWEQPYLLNEFRLNPDFHFETPELERLYELLKDTGEISSYDLAQVGGEVREAWYLVLE